MDYSIKELLDSAFNNPQIAAKAKENMVFPLWNTVVGQKIASRAHPYRLEDGILKVIVSSSTWAQELTFMKEQIINGYLDLIGYEVVKDIKFYPGKSIRKEDKEEKVEQLSLDFNKQIYPDDFQLQRLMLPEETMKIIKDCTVSIKDEQLKKQVSCIMEEEYKTKLWKEKKGWKTCPKCNVLMEPKETVCMICNINKEKNKRGRKKKHNTD